MGNPEGVAEGVCESPLTCYLLFAIAIGAPVAAEVACIGLSGVPGLGGFTLGLLLRLRLLLLTLLLLLLLPPLLLLLGLCLRLRLRLRPVLLFLLCALLLLLLLLQMLLLHLLLHMLLLPLRGLLLARVFLVALGLFAQGALAYGFFTLAALLFQLGALQFFLLLPLLALLFALGLLLAALCLFGGAAVGGGAGLGIGRLGALLCLVAGPRVALRLFAQGALAYGLLALSPLLFELGGLQLFPLLSLLALLLALCALAGFQGSAIRRGCGAWGLHAAWRGGAGMPFIPVVIAPGVPPIVAALVMPAVAAADHRPGGHCGWRQGGCGHGALPFAHLCQARALRQCCTVRDELRAAQVGTA